MSENQWWSPERHADRRPMLLARNRVQAAIRGYLIGAGFTEVDPPALVVSPGNETHLHAFETQAIGNDGVARPMYLHTSPEFAMKKLLAAGEGRIAAFTHVWRNRERGARHSPEFTMLEWYRAGEDYAVLMDDVAAMIRLAAGVVGVDLLRHGEAVCDPALPYERLSVAEAFDLHAGIDLLATVSADAIPDRNALATQTARVGVAFGPDENWSDIFARVLAERVEPHLGRERITVLDRYPACEAALARTCADDPREAERFEVYACGVELANGFGELTDPVEQRRRFMADMDEKERIYGTRYPLDEDFLAALAIMPDASGIAMGFDRLVMLATGAPKIDDILWVPVS
ncbi:EF-P lysine aminoacylase EpmA [uncultured Maritimibacter sp.]|jgi:lysyl-tRNA synthetase class 2|uniref:EF-P lysine aminoacylase EpmA n=1 Tax=uncultured Maritimibacter sp. TaxID=991866 RepID=UPI000A7DBFDA|nr:EF-P lysine aminoacylase EpmA [uncultured Maritimibacter sp.]